MPARPVSHTTQTTSVYMVEDDPDVVALVRSVHGGDTKLRVATTAEQAMKELDAGEPPDLVILDLDLPGRDGLAVLEALRADPRCQFVPVVIFTATDLPPSRGYALGANAWVHKPSDARRLEEAIEAILAFWGRWNHAGR